MNIVVMFGMISASLARAGSRVGGASRCRSIPSNTRTNLRCLNPVQRSTSLLSSTTSCARFSHRPTLSGQSMAVATAPIVCSNRCLPPMHSADLIIAYRMSSSCPAFPLTCPFICFFDNSSRVALVMAVFPVASRPCRTMFRHGAERI